MFKLSRKLANLIPLILLKSIGAMIILNQPKGFLVHASGKGAPVLKRWSPNWMSNLLTKIIPLSPGLFIDAGANVGQTLLAYKVANGNEYLGIEPNPICAGFVDELISYNGASDSKIVPLALADKNGISRLFTSYPTDTGATMVTNLRSIEGRHEQIIPTYTLDYLVELLEVPDVGIIKIDVESFELEVIRGMRKILSEKAPLVICEILGTANGRPLEIKKERNNEIYQILLEAGYTIYRLKKSGDASEVVGLEVVKLFPDLYWSEETNEMFDYLFVPADKLEQVKAMSFL